NVSKKFSHTLRQMMYYGIKDIARGTIGLPSNSDKLRKGEFWAVDNVSFEMKKGETLGIIGPNGSGKTTMLKLLNGILMPDKGRIEVKGKVGALIEVGAGFHPMLTGRENIYVSGAILGMTKKEIDKKFDSIVDFADIGDFLDSPVKYYSSGMYVRLGFAVAVHCEPDILLIDEILAVGDMSFQRKCLDRMEDLCKKETTIVFVSHNLHTVDGLCNRAICLNKGVIIQKGKTGEVIQAYQSYVNEQIRKGVRAEFGFETDYSSKEIEITNVQFFDAQGNEKSTFFTNEKMRVKVNYFAPRRFEKPVFSIGVVHANGLTCVAERSKYHDIEIDYIEGEGSFEVEFERVQLVAGTYTFAVAIFDSTITLPYAYRREDTFRVESYMPYTGEICGVFHPRIIWKCSKEK
ncbi:MAG: ABC transporter ATP-binding protein, partial [Planctomycetota bacterium]|nr:ABC transporter ATP-binding protein [Planctomycetota bacterium]